MAIFIKSCDYNVVYFRTLTTCFVTKVTPVVCGRRKRWIQDSLPSRQPLEDSQDQQIEPTFNRSIGSIGHYISSGSLKKISTMLLKI